MVAQQNVNMVVFLTKFFVFLFCLNFVSPWPTGYEEDEFEIPLEDDVPSYFKGKKNKTTSPKLVSTFTELLKSKRPKS